MKVNKILKAAAIILLPLLLVSCAGTESASPLAYQSRSAEMELCGEMRGVTYAATLSLGAIPAGGTRDIRLEFSEPEVLRGVCIVREGGVWGARAGEISFSGDAAQKLGLPAEAFELDGEVTFSGMSEDKFALFSVACADGCTAQIRQNGETPVSIVLTFPDGGKLTANVTSYTPRD